MRRAVLGVLAILCCPAVALGHAERATFYPQHDKGSVPKRDRSRVDIVVCKPSSRAKIRRTFAGKAERARLKLARRCRLQNIQAAVDRAKSGDRIGVLPGVYKELPSRAVPVNDPKCEGAKYWESSGDQHQVDGRVPTYLHQVDCPNSRNLVAVIGDSLDADRVCDHLCNLTIEGFGKRREDVLVKGDRRKPDVIRADRADGFQLRNLTVEQGAYNDIDVVETNGFRLDRLVARWASHYGILTFTTDNGLYDHIEAYGSGDSGVYPGSGPERHCVDYGIEVRNVNAYGNTLAASGTAGNGTWTHDNHFHDNAAGIANDSFAPGHPGMPQDCSKWTGNVIHSNNVNLFDDANEAYCNSTPFEKRRKKVVCPVFQVVVGTGFMFYGVNDNIISGNYIYDQHRNGIRQFAVPAAARGEGDPAKAYDTSHGNRYTGNHLGVRPDGTPDRNGLDVYWDEQGLRNCWEGNSTAPGRAVTSDPTTLPTCASGGSINPVGNTAKLAQDLPCITWHPQTNPDPPGCTWFTTPADPGARAFAAQPLFASSAAPVSAPGESARGGLAWDGQPELIHPEGLPDDRILAGRLRNTSGAPLRLDGATAVLRDDAGRVVRGGVSYARGFSHGLYGPGVSPKEPMPDFLATRLGTTAVVGPGETVPFTVSWRGAAPSSADLGSAAVALPATR
jgi:hypothetical protein